MTRHERASHFMVGLFAATHAGCTQGGATGLATLHVGNSWDAGLLSAGDAGPSHDGGIGGSTPPPTTSADAANGDDAATSDLAPGAPIVAPSGVWTNVPFPDAYCRDGTQAHLMVHLNSASSKIAIYEEGGGACFNDPTCQFLTVDLPSYALGQGIFNFNNRDNPIGDWNIFYVPYCTGDVQSGDNVATPGPNTGSTHYSGYTNLKQYLSRILPTVPNATDVLLTGSSAGGFGAAMTTDLVVRNLPDSVVRFTLLDDSGPPMSNQYIPDCLQTEWSNIWGLNKTVVHDCGMACPDPVNWVEDLTQYLVHKYAQGQNADRFMGGLISSNADFIISTFYGYGADWCTVTSPVQLTADQYTAGLLETRSLFQRETTHFGTFYYTSSAHTTLLFDNAATFGKTGLLGGLYSTTAGGVKLTDWVRDLLSHKQALHVGP